MNTHSALPLVSINAVAFDTETTGLDTSRARIIQIGGVRIRQAQVLAHESFTQYVNPAEPIPPASTVIHHITDADVASAATFEAVNNAFKLWCDDTILIGYATGFDLAMLRREHLLAGLAWEAPQALDVRHLAQIVAPNLPDNSLDTLADWLGIKISGRHSALGDALATANIFIALIPRLRERGIRTLAEAERACLQFTQLATTEISLGWQEPARTQDQQSLAALTRIDSFPYRHRLRDLMHSPVIFVSASERLDQVLDKLIEHKISAVYVTADASPGIITERDMLRAINRDADAMTRLTAGDIAVFPLLSLSADAFVYRAIARMMRHRIRHLGVHDDAGNIVGALSARDLLRQRADKAIVLGDDIDHAENGEAMAHVWGNIALVARGLALEEVDARDIAAVISRELCALTRQACILAEAEMAQQGMGEAPCRYAMLVLGSGGRGESLLAMDQDNAIVYAEGEAGGAQDRWFAELGKRVSDLLDVAGVPYCTGNIMASNSDWRHSREQWQSTIQTWIRRQTPDDILNCDIFFDAVCVHGDQELADQTLDFAFTLGAQSSAFIKQISINACKYGTPLGMFGRFQLTDGRIDLKKNGIMPIFSCARVLAIQHQQRALTTGGRMLAVAALKPTMQTSFDNLIDAHQVIFNAILQQQLADLAAGIPPSNRVAPAKLSSSLRKQLKWALQQVPNISNLLGDPLSAL